VLESVDSRVGAIILSAITGRLGGDGEEADDSAFANHFRYSIQGQFDASWLACYDYFRTVENLPAVARLSGLIRTARACGWWWPLPGLVLLTERPDRIERDADGRLHAEGAPAIRYRDGWVLYAQHGVRMSRQFALYPGSLTTEAILGETNMEVRRAQLERERFPNGLPAGGGILLDPRIKLVHQDDFGTLYRLEVRSREPIVVVKVVNATPEPDGTFKDYVLRVPPWILKAREAVAWTFTLEETGYDPKTQS
jgi:hypothetical protein